MTGLTTLGTFHTAISLVAVFCGFYVLAIQPRGRSVVSLNPRPAGVYSHVSSCLLAAPQRAAIQ